jgi:hypothetical protein
MFDGLMPVDLDFPSAKGLAYVLRHRELWPAGFTWDYGYCDTCAIGLASRLWAISSIELGRAIGLDPLHSRAVFVKAGAVKNVGWQDITPEDVAGLLELVVDMQAEGRV